MKTHLRMIVWLLPVVVFLAACQQEPLPPPSAPPPSTTTSAYYIRFKIDGILHQYSSSTDAAYINTFSAQDSLYYCTFLGSAVPGTVTENCIYLTMRDEQPLSPLIDYTNFTSLSATDHRLPWFQVMYVDADGTQFMNWPEDMAATLGTIADARVTITQLTPTEVKASFSASLYGASSLAPAHLLTDGELYLIRY